MKTSEKENVQLIVNLAVSYGLKYVVISPGSRNAPLIIAFNQHPAIECIVIPDERSAAFFALGMAQQTTDFVALLCTSGSAPLNYYPAIAEAFYQRIPLLVFTADRPSSLINQGDGQTIVQDKVFENHINFSARIEDSEINKELVKETISKAFHFAAAGSKGPVHINIGLNEPLYNQIEVQATNLESKLALTSYNLSKNQEKSIAEIWNSSTKKLIIVGQLNPNSFLLEELKLLVLDSSVAVLVEHTSNLNDQRFIHCIDRTLNSIQEVQVSDYKADLIIYIGGAIVSKKIKSFFRTHKAENQWKVGVDFTEMDTFQQVTESFEFLETDFIRYLNSINKKDSLSNFGLKWKQLDFLIQEKAKNYFLGDNPFSDLSVFNLLLDVVPENSNLHLANSSVIRYSLLFDPVKSIKYWCNRGTSGIDGSTSTAFGASIIKKGDWHTLITGDMSFVYDSNAFWNNLTAPNLRIFLINNGGGGIFKIIPGPDTTKELEDFFVFSNQASAHDICKSFKIPYFKANSLEEIDNQLEKFYTYIENGRPQVMEIFTQEIENEKILKEYFEIIAVS